MECWGKVFDGICKLSQLEGLVFSTCPQNPVNGLKTAGPKLIWKKPTRNELMSQNLKENKCF